MEAFPGKIMYYGMTNGMFKGPVEFVPRGDAFSVVVYFLCRELIEKVPLVVRL